MSDFLQRLKDVKQVKKNQAEAKVKSGDVKYEYIQIQKLADGSYKRSEPHPTKKEQRLELSRKIDNVLLMEEFYMVKKQIALEGEKWLFGDYIPFITDRTYIEKD